MNRFNFGTQVGNEMTNMQLTGINASKRSRRLGHLEDTLLNSDTSSNTDMGNIERSEDTINVEWDLSDIGSEQTEPMQKKINNDIKYIESLTQIEEPDIKKLVMEKRKGGIDNANVRH